MTERTSKLWVQRGQWLIAALAVSGFLYLVAQSWLKPPLPAAAASLTPLPEGCAPGLTGQPGRHMDVQTPHGLRYSVVAPSNYQPTQRHGLLMMYSPAGFSNDLAERYYRLSEEANRHGYVVVFSDAIPLSARALRLQSEVVPDVVAHWCIDPERVVFAGHSDGGSVTTGLTVRASVSPPPTRIVSSAAGITAQDLQQEPCPAPLHVTVLHNPKDQLFPGYGEGVVTWWGQCMQCTEQVQTEPSGCVVRQCAQGKVLRHCVTSEPHVVWPAVAAHLFEWLD